MDLLLPDETAMENMRREFSLLGVDGRIKAMTSALCAVSHPQNGEQNLPYAAEIEDDIASPDAIVFKDDSPSSDALLSGESQRALPPARPAAAPGYAAFECTVSQKARTLSLLILYFARMLGYNVRYGTEINDPERGLGRLRPDSFAFGKLNGI